MGTSFGFSCADVIQCVQKNRPGPALATYHLLLRKRKEEKAKRRATEQLSKAIRHHIDLKMKRDPEPAFRIEEVGKEGHLGVEEVGRKSNSFRTEEKREDQGSNGSHNQIITRRIEDTSTDNEVNLTPNMNNIAPVINTVPPKQDEESLGRIDIAPDGVTEKLIPSDASERILTSTPISQTNNNTKPTMASCTPPTVRRSRGADVKDLIANMRRTREVLQRRHNQKQEARKLEPPQTETQNRPKSPYKEALWETSRPFRPLSMRRTNPETLNRPSTTGQSHSSERSTEPVATRPLSQNSTTAKRPSKIFAHRRNIYAQATTKTSRYTPDWLRSQKESDRVEKMHTTLPAIVNKPESNVEAKPVGKSILKLPERARNTRHSLPAYIENGSAKGGLGDLKTVSSRNGTAIHADDSKLVINRSKLGYYVTKTNEKSSPPANRPKKVISEPIAAAISYLTSSKHRNMRRDKITY